MMPWESIKSTLKTQILPSWYMIVRSQRLWNMQKAKLMFCSAMVSKRSSLLEIKVTEKVKSTRLSSKSGLTSMASSISTSAQLIMSEQSNCSLKWTTLILLEDLCISWIACKEWDQIMRDNWWEKNKKYVSCIYLGFLSELKWSITRTKNLWTHIGSDQIVMTGLPRTLSVRNKWTKYSIKCHMLEKCLKLKSRKLKILMLLKQLSSKKLIRNWWNLTSSKENYWKLSGGIRISWNGSKDVFASLFAFPWFSLFWLSTTLIFGNRTRNMKLRKTRLKRKCFWTNRCLLSQLKRISEKTGS